MRRSREQLYPASASVPRPMKKVLLQVVGLCVIVFLWYTLNGGLIPAFLTPQLPFLYVGPDVGCLVFFNVENDASRIQWEREANSRTAVKEAMKRDHIHMVSGDVLLQGQGTQGQKLVPVMALPPDTESDINLKDWLHETRYGTKGIKLHIHSMEAVEISLQILKDFNELHPMKYPVWLHIDVLQGPHGKHPKIDFKRFIKIQQRLFPKCTLSLGWSTDITTDLSQSAYTWDMVWDMFDLVQGADLEDQLLIFQARFSLTHNSVAPLKWLCDSFEHSSLMVYHEDGDLVIYEDIMHLAYRFPPHKIYFDFQELHLQEHLDQNRHNSRPKLGHYALQRDEVMFKSDMWLKMGFHVQKNSILASSESIILATPIAWIVTKSKYRPTDQIFFQGRIRFFNRNKREAEDYRTGLDIYIRPSKYETFEEIRAVRCFIGAGGEIEVSGSHQPDNVPDFRQTARVTPTRENCYRFKIVDDGQIVSFSVKPLHDCTTLESVEEDDLMHPLIKAEIPKKISRNDQRPVILKMDDVKRQVLIDEFSVKHKMSGA